MTEVTKESTHEIQESPESFQSPYVPRRLAHPKKPVRVRDVVKKVLSPLTPVSRQHEAEEKTRKAPVKPRLMPKTSRYRARRRTKRLRRALKLRLIKWSKRVLISWMAALVFAAIVFWAKFAIVYNVPPYMQQGPLHNAQAYVVLKSWWFGPPSFNLASYPIADPQAPIQSLVMQLERYQDIVTNPNEILFILVKSKYEH